MEQFSSITPTTVVFEGKTVPAKIVSISSRFLHNAEYFFSQELIKQNTLEIVKPLAVIRFLKQNGGSEYWQEGFEYELEIKPFGLFNLWGTHHIKVVRIDKAGTKIITVEKNNICKVWNHTLTFRKVSETETEYTDEVVLYAGWLTGFLAPSLVSSYKTRHKNWNKLLNKKRSGV